MTQTKKRKQDNFPSSVISNVAKRVNYLCSNPLCNALTIGADEGENKVRNIGVAGHIKAASPGAKRYDENQTPKERSR